MKYKVAIVDDHKIFRDGFKMLLDSLDSVDTVYEASNGVEFLELLDKETIDLVFMDVNMPEMDGAKATEKALKKQKGLKIVAITAYELVDYVNKMLYSGVEGYLLKDADYDEIEEAINQVMSGSNYFSKKILVSLSRNTIKSKKDEKKRKEMPNLSKRELEVLQLICKGVSTKDIAKRLFISQRTVEKHKENLMQKAGVRTTVNLVIFALKHKLADI
jgi:DNA-binding NarL/FixJ family response regulator